MTALSISQASTTHWVPRLTSAAPDSSLSSPPSSQSEAGWTDVKARIEEWIGISSPGEDEIPTLIASGVALKVAELLQQGGIYPPLRTLAAADGGVAFEWVHANAESTTAQIWGEGDAELIRYRNGQVVSRKPIKAY